MCFLSEWNKKERDLFLSKMEKVVAPLCSHKGGATLMSQDPFVDMDGFYRERENAGDSVLLACPLLVWAV